MPSTWIRIRAISPTREFQKKKSDAELADAIQRGGAGVGLSALMPPWGHTLSARQIDELVLYLRTLPTLRKPAS